jgi:HK97 family phage major capsid protein
MKERIKELNAELQRLNSEADAKYKDIQAKSDNGKKSYDGWSDDLQTWNNMLDDGRKKRLELDGLTKSEELAEDLYTPEPKSRPATRSAKPTTISKLLLESDEYKADPKAKNGLAFEVDLEKKDLAELTAAEGGALVWSDRLNEIVATPLRPLTVLNLLRKRPTSSNAVDYRERLTFDNQAALVAERGEKPKSNHTFALKTAKIVKVAHYEVVTEEIMDDVPFLRALIDQDLADGVMRKLEEMVVSNAVTPTGITGIINAAATARVHQVASGGLGAGTDNVFDTIRYAIADLVMKFYRPDSIIIDPILSAKLDTAKDAEGRYIMSYDPVVKRMWGLMTAESAGTLVPAGTALVMDSARGPVLLDRRVQSIKIGWINDQFITNEFCILAEGRYGLMTQYPDAINKVTGL